MRGAFGHRQRRLRGQRVIAIGNHVVLPHHQKHDIAAVAQAVRVAERVEIGGPLDQAGELGGFGQRDLAQVLAQIGFRRLSKTADAEEITKAIVSCMNDDFYFNDLVNSAVLLKLQHKRTSYQY